jgi:transposase
MQRRAFRVTMSMRELDRLKCIQAVIEGGLPAGAAAERLCMSARQIRRLTQRYRGEGPVGLISRRCRRPSNNRLDEALERRVVEILREHYADFGPTLAAEKLAERHQILLAKETIRRIQIDAGLWIPRKLRAPKIQQPRTRRACLGELIQIDGCEHRWFEERAPMCTVLVYVDDATSRLMTVRFTGSESTFAYFEATREYLGRHGKPLALYSDKASIFRVNHPQAAKGPGFTQFARALYELNIDGICANTPAAKGRVERAHLTLQDRLVKELRLEGISSLEGANAFMPRFIEAYNRRFAKAPREGYDAHRAVRADEDLDLIFAWRELRKVTQSLTLHYERQLYLLADTADNRRLIGKYVEVFQYPDGRIEIRVAGQSVPYSRYDKLGAIDQGAIVENKRLGQVLRVAQEVQAHRDNRSVNVPSTAHRADGTRIPRSRIAGSKKQRELGAADLQQAIEQVHPELLPPLAGRQTARRGRPCQWD